MIWGLEYFYSDFNNFNAALKKGKKYKETKKICFKFFAILGICHFEA